jgi:hypothetical protein
MPSCFIFDEHDERRAISRARDIEGMIIDAKIEIMAITVKSSMSVKARRGEVEVKSIAKGTKE